MLGPQALVRDRGPELVSRVVHTPPHPRGPSFPGENSLGRNPPPQPSLRAGGQQGKGTGGLRAIPRQVFGEKVFKPSLAERGAQPAPRPLHIQAAVGPVARMPIQVGRWDTVTQPQGQ